MTCGESQHEVYFSKDDGGGVDVLYTPTACECTKAQIAALRTELAEERRKAAELAVEWVKRGQEIERLKEATNERA